MNFKRRKIKGQNQKTRQTWLSEEQYRIVWCKEVFSVAVIPHYQATIRITLNGEMWDFVAKSRYRTFKAAQDACEKHYALWTKVTKLKGKRELEKLFGKIPLGCPNWVKPLLNQKILTLITTS